MNKPEYTTNRKRMHFDYLLHFTFKVLHFTVKKSLSSLSNLLTGKVVPFFILPLLTLSQFSCEKRILLETGFLYEKDRIFCEVIGFPATGFIGTVTQVEPVEPGNFEHQKIRLILREEGNIIFDTVPPAPSFSLPYDIQNDTDYSLEVQYKDQIITSRRNKKAAPKLTIEAASGKNEFIDSLGFFVVTVGFNFMNPANVAEGLYFTYHIELLSSPSLPINFFGTETAEAVDASTNVISKRLANIAGDAFGRISLLSLDKEFYQYLKNINRLGIIPNDEIEGHQGNLEGGIGYFGIVNYDVEVVEF